ncbi:MAG: hypothetical protein IT442_07605 [Phycisphaeraceae bacterium]|nr:hypothetical protein [Phycisphaeraceae bacterium]
MSRSLPTRPALSHLRKEAKAILLAHHAKDASVLPTLRGLHRFSKAGAAEIFAAELALHDIQFALAIEYGFSSWEKLKAHVVSAAFAEKGKAPDPRRARLIATHEDSFTVTLQAAGRLFGKAFDYPTLYALSTNGFAPDICPEESCRSTWRMLGRGGCIDLVAGYMGLEARPIRYVSPPRRGVVPGGRFWGTPAAAKWLSEEMRACAAVLRTELEAEGVVVTSGGWQHHWEMWGIIFEAREDGTIVGQAQLGPPENVLDHAQSFWALHPAEESLGQEDADRRMLEHALHRIRGDREPFRAGRIVHGLQAMDLWAAQMLKPAFQEDSPGDSASNASLCARYTCEGARLVSAYLRQRTLSFQAPARPHVGKVSDRYARIAELRDPFVTQGEGTGYDDMMGDPLRQKQHVQEVLMPVRAELAGAAGDIEAVLHILRP